MAARKKTTRKKTTARRGRPPAAAKLRDENAKLQQALERSAEVLDRAVSLMPKAKVQLRAVVECPACECINYIDPEAAPPGSIQTCEHCNVGVFLLVD